ncbi:DUF2846 domain-containing protein [Sphingomonas psychrotolerans]|uniref:DUF2846 domain-containing protein n=1 Tax=Sphingomonas psychrotolerans TaxID=1327635 RepID=A0ABU3MYW0_9SPHN|nr:hypothetical protein [Sphingomonas psychrotolerans]MDT8757151.1 DUF2846 domain-containing protein [Sphingomonas psychrotolerans]
MNKALGMALLGVSLGLAAPAMGQEAAAAVDAPAPAAATASAAVEAPIVTKSGTIGAAPAGKAQVVFWRPGSIMGMALGCTVREGEGAAEVEVARLGAGKYWVHTAEPGKHVYYTTGEATDRLNMELEEGETYFVRCAIGMGIMSGRAQVSPSDRATFLGRAKKMKLWNKKGEGDKKAARAS